MHRTRTALLTAIVIVGALAACSAGGTPDPTSSTAPDTTATSTTPVARPDGAVDRLVAVRGARLHLRCDGAGDTTVVLLAGFTDGGEQWGPMQAELGGQARVCAYARFGTGTSDPAPGTQTFATEAADLHALLEAAGEPGPYVLVGHSFGGPVAVTFADRYPGEVVGLALIDASPAGWYNAVCAVPDDGTESARSFAGLCASLTDPGTNVERLDGALAFAEVGTVGDLGDLPVTVVTAARRTLFADTAPSVATRLNEVWDAGQAEWVGLSTRSHLVTIEGVGHYVHLERPDLVVDQVRRLLP